VYGRVPLGLALSLLLFSLVVSTSPSPTQPPPAAEDDAAVAAVAATLDTARVLLEEDLLRYGRVAQARGRLSGRLAELYRTLQTAVTAEQESQRANVEQLLTQIRRAEAERGAANVDERALVGRILERRREIELLEAQLAMLAGRRAVNEGPLSGDWKVVLLPVEQRGSFRLRQNGTLISGTYTLSGGQTGSLQGTLVNRKVFLVRIDSKLGRSMELEGFLSSDGLQIRGNWMSYELAESETATGEWSARKSGNER